MFDLNHWDNPRETIACIHLKDDISYAIHGAHMAADAIKLFDLKPSEMAEMTIIDYGSGTGRIARVLSRYFKHVYAFEPNKECHAAALKECPEIKLHNVTFVNDFNDVPNCNLSLSVNVIEHLSGALAVQAIENMLNKSAKIALWYHRGAPYMHKYRREKIKGETILNAVVTR